LSVTRSLRLDTEAIKKNAGEPWRVPRRKRSGCLELEDQLDRQLDITTLVSIDRGYTLLGVYYGR